MKKQNGTIEFTGKNFKIVNLEFNGSDVYFDIQIGNKLMYMVGELEFNCTVDCGEFVVDTCDLMLQKFQWEHNMQLGILNKRNTILICEEIEQIAMLDPEKYGFDMEQYESDQMNWNAELNYQISREQCY